MFVRSLSLNSNLFRAGFSKRKFKSPAWAVPFLFSLIGPAQLLPSFLLFPTARLGRHSSFFSFLSTFRPGPRCRFFLLPLCSAAPRVASAMAPLRPPPPIPSNDATNRYRQPQRGVPSVITSRDTVLCSVSSPLRRANSCRGELLSPFAAPATTPLSASTNYKRRSVNTQGAVSLIHFTHLALSAKNCHFSPSSSAAVATRICRR